MDRLLATHMKRVAWLFVALFPFAGGMPWANAASADLDVLATELARIRGEVERLQQDLDQARDRRHQAMEALGAQISQLEAEKRRQELAVKRLRHELEKVKEHDASTQVPDVELVPALQNALALLEAQVRRNLPFKPTERMNAIGAMKAKLEAGNVPAKRLANEIWAMYEDELRLTRENGLYQQVIPLSGSAVLADVAKLGMVQMYYRDGDGNYGMSINRGGEWQFTPLSSPEDAQRIEHLMDSLRKQIRQGYFELPTSPQSR